MCYHSKAQEDITLTLMSKVLRGDRPYKKQQKLKQTLEGDAHDTQHCDSESRDFLYVEKNNV